MTSNIRRLAGGVTILDAIWIFYVYFTSPPYLATCAPGGSCVSFANFLHSYLAFEGLAVILLVLGGLGIWGVSFAYVVGAVFSVISLVFMGANAFETSSLSNLSWEFFQSIVGAIIAVVAIMGNAIASRRKELLSEQANPMNLPVFG